MQRQLEAFVGGGLAFWIPAAVVEVITGPNFSLVLANILPFAAAAVALATLNRRAQRLGCGAFYMLLGIYVLAPTAIYIATARFGGGFAGNWGAADFLWYAVSSLFPPLTWVVAGYNGTLIGLAAVTVLLLWAGLRRSPHARRVWHRYIGRPERG